MAAARQLRVSSHAPAFPTAQVHISLLLLMVSYASSLDSQRRMGWSRRRGASPFQASAVPLISLGDSFWREIVAPQVKLRGSRRAQDPLNNGGRVGSHRAQPETECVPTHRTRVGGGEQKERPKATASASRLGVSEPAQRHRQPRVGRISTCIRATWRLPACVARSERPERPRPARTSTGRGHRSPGCMAVGIGEPCPALLATD
jgi:septal ring-binding cell division protein DamX